MDLLDLPTEITRLIVQHSYEPWNVHLRKLQINKDASWRFEASGVPDWNLQLTCHTLSNMAKEAEKYSFTGKMYIEEETSAMSLVYEAFIETAQTNAKLDWVRRNITALRFSNPTHNPATWRFVHSLYAPELPKLRRIELDCRYFYHFATHNVPNAEDFISGKDGKLEKAIDFRQSFFLRCERFMVHSVRRGTAIRVIRDMSVREGTDRCRAVVILDVLRCSWGFADVIEQAVAIDYVADDAGKLVLDWNTLETKAAVINGWPRNIRQALGTLDI